MAQEVPAFGGYDDERLRMERKRAIADALMARGIDASPKNMAQGLSQVGLALMGRFADKKADRLETAYGDRRRAEGERFIAANFPGEDGAPPVDAATKPGTSAVAEALTMPPAASSAMAPPPKPGVVPAGMGATDGVNPDVAAALAAPQGKPVAPTMPQGIAPPAAPQADSVAEALMQGGADQLAPGKSGASAPTAPGAMTSQPMGSIAAIVRARAAATGDAVEAVEWGRQQMQAAQELELERAKIDQPEYLAPTPVQIDGKIYMVQYPKTGQGEPIVREGTPYEAPDAMSEYEAARIAMERERLALAQQGAARLAMEERKWEEERAIGKTRGAPSGYRFEQDGSLSAIPGGPADKASTGESYSTTEVANYTKKAASLDEFQNALKIYVGALETNGGPQTLEGLWNEDQRRSIDTAHKQLQLAIKNVAQTGALDAGSISVVNGMIGDPTGWGAMGSRTGNVKNALENIVAQLEYQRTQIPQQFVDRARPNGAPDFSWGGKAADRDPAEDDDLGLGTAPASPAQRGALTPEEEAEYERLSQELGLQ